VEIADIDKRGKISLVLVEDESADGDAAPADAATGSGTAPADAATASS
jgi:polyribonucleotide nucleotidyltransferase